MMPADTDLLTLLFKTTATALLAVVLAACGATPSRHVTLSQRADAANQLDVAFCEGLMTDPALDPIRHKTLVGSAAQSAAEVLPYEMIADRLPATDRERRVIAYWTGRDAVCRDRLRATDLRQGRPVLAAHREAIAQAEAALRVPLLIGEWSWGQYNVARRGLLAEVRRSDAAIRAALQTGDDEAAARLQQQAALTLDGALSRQRMALLSFDPVMRRAGDDQR